MTTMDNENASTERQKIASYSRARRGDFVRGRKVNRNFATDTISSVYFVTRTIVSVLSNYIKKSSRGLVGIETSCYKVYPMTPS